MEDKIINLNEVREAKELLEGISNADFGIEKFLEMTDEEIDLVGPGLLESYEMTLADANSRILLAQSFTANGIYIDDINRSFEELCTSFDANEKYSEKKKGFLKQFIGIMVRALNETQGIAKRVIPLPVELCHENAQMPQYAHVTDAGMDIYAIEDVTIAPGETKLVRTGIKLAIPTGYEIQVRPKSGRALKTKMRVANSPGTIDSDYRDEVCVIIDNTEPRIKDITYEFDEKGRPIITSILHGDAMYIGTGEKFAQLVLKEQPKAAPYRVENVMEIGENRGGGFGSTDLK